MKNLSEINHDLDMVTKKYVDEVAATKVDKEEGKQLSTNDFTTEEKEKLDSLENYTLPMASADALGGIKIGKNLAIDENGALRADVDASNIHYGTDEPTDENTVMWIDPSQEPLSVLTIDNTEEYTPVGDYNPATKKYVDENCGTAQTGSITLFSSKKDRDGYLLCNNSVVKTDLYPTLSSAVATDFIVDTQLSYYTNTFFPKFINEKLFFTTSVNSFSALDISSMEREDFVNLNDNELFDIEYGNGRYCMTTKYSSSKKYIYYGTDLTNWTLATIDTTPNGSFHGLATNGEGIWMTKSYYQGAENYYVSTDNGATWSECSGNTKGYGTQIAYVHDRFITMNSSSQFYYNMGTTDAFVAFTDAGNLSMNIYKVGDEYYCLSGNGIYQINSDFSTTLVSTIPTEDTTNLIANMTSKGIVAYQGSTLYRSTDRSNYTTETVELSKAPSKIAMQDDTFIISSDTLLYQGFLEGKASRLPFKMDEKNQIYGYIHY